MIVLLLAILAQDPLLDDLLRGLTSEKIEIRNQSEKEILTRWKSWTDLDLSKLDEAARLKEAEAAGRAKQCLEAIRLYRVIPETIWKAFPNAGSTLRQGSADEVAEFIDLLREKWRGRELHTRDLLPVLICSLGDNRPTTRGTPLRALKVRDHVYNLLYDAVPRFNFDTKPEAVQTWWEENRSKPESGWYLPELTDKSEWRRAQAIQRLFALEDASLYPRLFQALKTIREVHGFLIAVRDASRLRQETVQLEFAPYLQDSRLEVRFLAAKLIAPFDRRTAIDSLLSTVDKPESLRSDAGALPPQYKIVDWLAATKDDRVFPVLRTLLKDGDFGAKQEVLHATGDLDDPRVEELLLQAMSDTHRSSEPVLWGQIDNPRLCDEAGFYLSKRLKVESRFEWGAATDGRDTNLAEIWKLYRERKGMPPAPFVTPGTTVVAAEEVAALLPDLASGEKASQQRALKSLSRLGGGAWPHLQAKIRESEGPTRKRLEEAALAFSNTLRKVEVSDDSRSCAKHLLDHLHETLDVDAFLKESINPWFGDATCTRIHVEVSREPGGRGIKIKMDVTKGDPKAPTPDNLYWNFHRRVSSEFSKEVFDEAWEDFLDPLRLNLLPGNEVPFNTEMEMTKRRSK
jgi:hypothetical protein